MGAIKNKVQRRINAQNRLIAQRNKLYEIEDKNSVYKIRKGKTITIKEKIELINKELDTLKDRLQ